MKNGRKGFSNTDIQWHFSRFFFQQLFEGSEEISSDTIKSELKIDAASWYSNLIRAAPKTIEEWDIPLQSEKKEFIKVWIDSFNLLYLFIILSTKTSEQFSLICGVEFQKTSPFTFKALIRLHAHACKISQEIHLLLLNGYPAGALARWRTLHECVVYARFIRIEGEDCAKRYLEYTAIENQKLQKTFLNCEKNPELFPHAQEFSESNERMRQKLKERYGSNFPETIGWAYGEKIKPKPGGKQKGLKFYEIQNAVKLGHLKFFYKMASEAIHLDSSYGISFDIGIPEESDFQILAGPSYFNLYLPIFLTAQSLFQMNDLLLTIKPNRNVGTFLFMMKMLYDDLNKSLESTEINLKKID